MLKLNNIEFILKKIDLHIPYLGKKEIKYLIQAINKNELTFGKNLNKFKKKILNFTKSKYAASVNSGTSAIFLSLKAIGVKANDEVIVPSLTFVATINSIIYANAAPIFIDVDKYCNIDVNKVIEFLQKHTFQKKGYTFNKKTKKKISCLIIVNTFGNMANISNKLVKLCKEKKIKILEDAAESFGSYYKADNSTKKHSGTLGDIGCFSFNGNKIITSAGGGVVVSNKREYIKKINYLANQAKENSIEFIHNEIGYNHRLSNIHASIGLAQIENIKYILEKKKRIHGFYLNDIKEINGLEMLVSPDYSISNYWLNIIKINKNYKYTKNILLKKLNKLNIQARPIWIPNHLQKPYLKFQKFKIRMTNIIYKNYLCLPSSPGLKKEQINSITKALR